MVSAALPEIDARVTEALSVAAHEKVAVTVSSTDLWASRRNTTSASRAAGMSSGDAELELIQSHMAQKPVLRGEVGCACHCRVSAARIEGLRVLPVESIG